MKHCWHTKIHGSKPLIGGGYFTCICCWCGETGMAQTVEIIPTGHGAFASELMTVWPEGECRNAPGFKLIPERQEAQFS